MITQSSTSQITAPSLSYAQRTSKRPALASTESTTWSMPTAACNHTRTPRLRRPQISELSAFFEEFARLVAERGLQANFGKKITSETDFDQAGWTEFEFADDRRTIMIPRVFPTLDDTYELSVETEFHAETGKDDDNNQCTHTRTCVHCSYPSKERGGLVVGGREVNPESPFYRFFNAVAGVWCLAL
ncbi:hypothetical protein BJY01DRAFT_245091 [Aspergillus pseudoustus]|uniref:Uncharacterized protein n=1 Tax=Aspergillus pseudoustus TaxID=1810923 RepID=A0ABR4KFU9_9EURO